MFIEPNSGQIELYSSDNIVTPPIKLYQLKGLLIWWFDSKPDLSAILLQQVIKYGNNLVVKCHIQANSSPTPSFWADNTQIINAELDAQRPHDGQTHIVSLKMPPNIACNNITCVASNDLRDVLKISILSKQRDHDLYMMNKFSCCSLLSGWDYLLEMIADTRSRDISIL